MTSLRRQRGLRSPTQLRGGPPQDPSCQLLTKKPESMRREKKSF
ncbi:uncharacterized protein CTRU02_214024 [Colletotrichum truncatum]|uniref:Uncharacterized protein n=1 Tax=Colletotrichum truncatum TaxID=5467 RepID=A0ACC3YHE9_COLTU|nr:uncharacterized protein CTRU02_06339 [Colletotrichum truncatum]KAF6792843.1 hypothetical protein CTRU02_06339 [Colletotrichum truncatum]